MLLIDSNVQQVLDGGEFGDGASTIFVRQLTYVESKAYDVVYADLPFRELFPVSNEVPEWANTIEYHVYDQVGIAKLIGSYSGDMPLADVHAKLVTSVVRSSGVGFRYSTAEVRAATQGMRSLEQSKANAARRANEQLFNDIAFDGDADSGLPGFLSNPNITSSTVPNGAGGSPLWTLKTPDEILADVNNLFSGINELTAGKESPNTLLLDIGNWNYIAATKVSELATMTIMQFIIANSPFINSASDIVKVPQLAGAGAGSTNLMVAYDKSPEKLKAHIPMEQKFYAAQMINLWFTIPSEARTGGVIIYFPLSVSIANGI